VAGSIPREHSTDTRRIGRQHSVHLGDIGTVPILPNLHNEWRRQRFPRALRRHLPLRRMVPASRVGHGGLAGT
jgi:hypothetical protein